MRSPIAYVCGNCVFARGLDDAWAAFVLEPHAYAWENEEGKRRRFLALLAAVEAVEADLQILRVAARWDADGYTRDVEAECRRFGAAQAHRRSRRHYLEGHRRRLVELAAFQPVVVLVVSLTEPRRDVPSFLATLAGEHRGGWRSRLLRGVGLAERRVLRVSELERARARAERVHACLSDYLQVRPAQASELQWLVRRAFCRGLGEPSVDPLHEPGALLFEHRGEAVVAPLEAEVMRWADAYVEHRGRALKVVGELGTSWQALLVTGALPDRATFPGSRAELMFVPAERLPFAVDLSLNTRYLPNELALRIARRRIQDADQIVRAEADGEQGVSDQGLRRAQDARDLVGYLQASSRPPLLRAALTVAVSARSEQELERRVEMCRRAFGEVRLYRPVGDQLQLFLQQLPAQRTAVGGYDQILTAEQVAALIPAGTHAAGSNRGFYLGHTLTGSRQPIRFNLREGSDADGNATILSVGALGSGKTTLAQKLQYEGFLQGARVVDCDPKGDHSFHLLDEVAPHVERLTLQPDARLRGVLDPLRIASPPVRQEVTVSFLRELLPRRVEAAWETALVAAVDRVLSRTHAPSCMEVVRALKDGDDVEAHVGAALEVYARSGLTQLGFADRGLKLPPVGSRQVTYLPIRDLPAPEVGLPRSEYSQAERVGAQIVRLIAMFAMQLMRAERARLKLFCFDEGWRLLGDPVGRALLASLQRMGRSELAVPIISTQLLSDALVGERESLENLVGATFIFGIRSEGEARRALTLLGRSADDPTARRSLLELDAGRCLFRDHRGRVEAIQVDVVIPELLRAFSTTPRRAG